MSKNPLQRLTVFQQNGSGEQKIAGVKSYGTDICSLEIINIDGQLPQLIDDTSQYLPSELHTDLVLDYLTHQDLAHDLAVLCGRLNIPIVSSGKKLPVKGAMTPPTCCGLPRQNLLGHYGERFGAPEFEVTITDDIIAAVEVVRGAPCAATWEVVKKLIGTPVTDAPRKIGLEVQYFCSANTAGWDPIYGKSPVHFAGKVHSQALINAIDQALAKTKV